MAATTPADGRAAGRHPLDPLSADEIRRAVTILRRDRGVGPRWRFGWIELAEPHKRAARGRAAGEPGERAADVVCWSRDDGRAYKARVSLSGDRVLSWEHCPGVQPNFTVDEYNTCNEALKKDPRVIAALERHGIRDLDRVLIDTWAYGGLLVPEKHRDRRVGWTDIWVYNEDGSNPYANPVTGLHLVVDVNTLELLEIDDAGHERPRTMGEYVPELVPGQRLRDDVKPLRIVQPEGVSFTLEGTLLSWQRWSMRLGFNPREGLVIHSVGYEDPGPPTRVRPVAHRLSFAEMVVPYRDPTDDHKARTAFDIGEWGLGFMTTSLELGCDCLGEIAYLDATVTDDTGAPRTIPNAICIHEEDFGILWKHTDIFNGSAQSRRQRRLVVSYFTTVGNYDYGFYWYFYLDGTIELEVKATGILFTSAHPGGDHAYSTEVAPGLAAPYHQHLFSARLDMSVDGQANAVEEVDVSGLPIGPDNPYGNAIVQQVTRLTRESQAGRRTDGTRGRTWRIISTERANRFGRPTSYTLYPEPAPALLADPDSPVAARAGFAANHLWVTRYDPDQRWPAGDFVNQNPGGAGLPAFTAGDRDIDGQDIVVWHTFGPTHIPRPEDWPVMPVARCGFVLKPTGFFDRNPTLDVAPPAAHCSDSQHGQRERHG